MSGETNALKITWIVAQALWEVQNPIEATEHDGWRDAGEDRSIAFHDAEAIVDALRSAHLLPDENGISHTEPAALPETPSAARTELSFFREMFRNACKSVEEEIVASGYKCVELIAQLGDRFVLLHGRKPEWGVRFRMYDVDDYVVGASAVEALENALRAVASASQPKEA